MGTRKPGGGMALEGMQQQKKSPNSCRFPAAAVQNLWELWKETPQHQQEGQLKRAALGVRGASAHV